MFKREKGVTITDIFGNKIGGFFPESAIKNGRLEVIIVKEECDKVLIRTRYSDYNAGAYGFINSCASCIYVYKELLN